MLHMYGHVAQRHHFASGCSIDIRYTGLYCMIMSLTTSVPGILMISTLTLGSRHCTAGVEAS